MDSAITPTKRKQIRPQHFNKFIASFVQSTCFIAPPQQFSTTLPPNSQNPPSFSIDNVTREGIIQNKESFNSLLLNNGPNVLTLRCLRIGNGTLKTFRNLQGTMRPCKHFDEAKREKSQQQNKSARINQTKRASKHELICNHSF